MAAPLRSKALGLGFLQIARVCRSSPHALALHALRAGRSHPIRLASTSAIPRLVPHPIHPENGATVADASNPNADQPKFESLQGIVSPPTLKALTQNPFKLTHMSPVQAAVLPLLPQLLEPSGPDLMVKARTGTGKTLAFLIPAVEARLKDLEAHAETVTKELMTSNRSAVRRAVAQRARETVGALIISPTRELATQIANEAIKLTRHQDGMEVRLFTGGLSKRAQMREWNSYRRDIVVATPGRLRDCIENEPGFEEALKTANTFILDEADTLLEMGFREDIEDIARCLKPAGERQTYMFSATMPSAIRQVASTTLASNYKFINCVPKDAAPTHLSIPQYYTSCSDANEQIAHILRLIAEDQLANPGKSKVLVFLSTTKMVQLYSMILMSIGKNALPLGRATRFEQIHSKKTMSSRMNISKWFRHHTGGSAVLLTSDVSARGVDYPGITRVIQIGVPSSSETYVHRVGRTGRGSNMNGRADLVLLPWENSFLRSPGTSDIPLRELPASELQAALGDKAERLSDESVRAELETLRTRVDADEVADALVSVLAFYKSNSGALRDPRQEEVVEGVRAWARALAGEHTFVPIPKDYIQRERFSRRGGDRGGDRGGRDRRGGGGFRSSRDRRDDAPWKGGRRERDRESSGRWPSRPRSEDGPSHRGQRLF